ncbi:BZ3500_MvSof-1268-A1-R1_Chr10-1g02583 [Microbotryum saponariae]|uniref:hydroxyacylglutathione hydrolase n=1 Tax=Microbotryum saponariae TaxID=289078 RepID=A0A2X0NEQ2_9BASI|nr:BZ3500_MvSof-1268-A1-R1_Chr10-1g02583 [Microbotryum saponariae]SDA06072.1 BZ3501_MvSof-1269-A2-R1_Chr10-1g02184 [Microbotryum saponariae]
MKIVPVPCRSDNYMYLLSDGTSNSAAVVDPYDVAKLHDAAKKEGLQVGQWLLTTHHHADHSGGNDEFIQLHPGVTVTGGSDKSPGVNKLLKHQETFEIGTLKVTAIHTPCHTQDHICYYVEDTKSDERAVFTGDTLFVSGCGRFFEGTAQEMHEALNKRLAQLPDDTKTYVGHEYTKSNVAFSSHVDPENPAIKSLVDFANKNEVTTGKFTLGDEKKHNVFMRLGSQAVKDKANSQDEVTCMQWLREAKNNFRG